MGMDNVAGLREMRSKVYEGLKEFLTGAGFASTHGHTRDFKPRLDVDGISLMLFVEVVRENSSCMVSLSDLVDTLRKPKLNITGWSNGRSPEDFGWVFANGSCLSCYDVSDSTSRDECNGIPDDVLDAFEEDCGSIHDEYGGELSDWLQNFN